MRASAGAFIKTPDCLPIPKNISTFATWHTACFSSSKHSDYGRRRHCIYSILGGHSPRRPFQEKQENRTGACPRHDALPGRRLSGRRRAGRMASRRRATRTPGGATARAPRQPAAAAHPGTAQPGAADGGRTKQRSTPRHPVRTGRPAIGKNSLGHGRGGAESIHLFGDIPAQILMPLENN